jgi:hypothetical protein
MARIGLVLSRVQKCIDIRQNGVEVMRIFAPSDLDRINDFVHDWPFDLDEIVFDKAGSTLTIGFTKEIFEERTVRRGGLIKRISIPITKCRLIIHHVISHEIVDTANIGSYPFDTIEYDADARRVSINTVVPLDFSVWVDRLELSIQKDEIPVGSKNDWMIDM